VSTISAALRGPQDQPPGIAERPPGARRSKCRTDCAGSAGCDL